MGQKNIKNQKSTKAQCSKQEISTLNFFPKKKRETKQVSSHCNFFTKNHKAQMELSFGMIFSIILIIIFIAFAVYGITKFLEISREAQIKNFLNNLQNDVDNMRSSSGEQIINRSYVLPKKITKVCFVNDSKNIELRSLKQTYPRRENINNIEFDPNLCVENINQKVKIRLSKGFRDNYVTLSAG